MSEKLTEEKNYILIKALCLLADWATDCDFGYDNIPDLYEKYKDEIKELDYTDGLIYIALNEAKKQVGE